MTVLSRVRAFLRGRTGFDRVLAEEFDAEYYLSKNPDVAFAGVDPLMHYLSIGWREGRWPNTWFDPNAYLAKFPQIDGHRVNPFVHFLRHRDQVAAENEEALQRLTRNQYLYWTLLRSKPDEAGPQPILIAPAQVKTEDINLVRSAFDAEYYCKTNPEIAALGVNPLMHFMHIGWIEGCDPSPEFSLGFYLRNNPDIAKANVNPFVHYLRNGKKEKWRKTARVDEAEVLQSFLEDAAMKARVTEACALEPMVALPDTPRRVTTPLLAAKPLTDVAEKLRAELGLRRYRYIIAVPHIRMSGAARVAAIFASALAELRAAGDVLIVSTDSQEAEYAHWLPEDIDWLCLSNFTGLLGAENQMYAFLDIMRGVGCETLINVNSRLAWEMLTLFGRQIPQEFTVVTYLFTWDETPSGARVGYPIQWLRDTANAHHLLFTDNRSLAEDVADRMGYHGGDGGVEVVPLYTPVDPAEAKPVTAAVPKSGSKPRFLWAGRFDRQKRVDILVAIARANPNFRFDVYGKPVLDGKPLQEYDPPGNLKTKGVYSDLSSVLETPYTGFLYTAQWDGIPTILLDIGAAGLPIVAPGVGGIPELLDSDTGWLVEDFTDVEAFSAALTEMAQDPAEATRRSSQMRDRIARQFSRDQYLNQIREAFERHGI